MLAIIIDTIDSSCGNDGEQRLYPSDDYLAFRILKVIEEEGMLPPTAYSSDTGEYFKITKEDVDYIDMASNLRIMWEPEDGR